MQTSYSIFQGLHSDTSSSEPDDSQNLSFLDSDIPVVPFDPTEVIEHLIPDLAPDPVLPSFDLAPLTGPPICEGNYFPFCCNQGPPNPAKDAEKQKRRRKCYDCRSGDFLETLW